MPFSRYSFRRGGANRQEICGRKKTSKIPEVGKEELREGARNQKSELLAKKEQCHRRRKDWQREKSDQIVRKLA